MMKWKGLQSVEFSLFYRLSEKNSGFYGRPKPEGEAWAS